MINFFDDRLDRNPVDNCAFTPLIDIEDSDYEGPGELISDIEYEALLESGDAKFARGTPSENHTRD